MLIALMALAACGADDAPEAADVPEGELTVRSLVPSMFRAAYPEPTNMVIRDTVAWAKLWDTVAADMTPKPNPPSVEFTSEMVLAICLGPGPDGRALGIRSVERIGDELVVTYGVREGGSGGVERRVGPCAIVAVPRSELNVKWSLVGD